MTKMISKPLLAALLASVVVSVVVVLRPDVSADSGESDLLPLPREEHVTAVPVEAVRSIKGRQLKAPPALRNQGYAPLPPPPPVVTAPVIAKPTAPTPPFVYLGRMVRDGQSIVFLGQGENVEAVSVGDQVAQDWQLERIDDRAVQLRYLPLNEVRQLITSN